MLSFDMANQLNVLRFGNNLLFPQLPEVILIILILLFLIILM